MLKGKDRRGSQWTGQGILLLNASLTVRAHQANSHSKKGWEQFTDAAIRSLGTARQGLVFLLWGRYAQQKAALIDTRKHHVLKAAHPSGLSAQRVTPALLSLLCMCAGMPVRYVHLCVHA